MQLMKTDFSMREVMTYSPALPKWEGSLKPDGFIGFPKQYAISRDVSFSPVGDIVPERSER